MDNLAQLQILPEVRMIYHRPPVAQRPVVHTSNDVVQLLRPLFQDEMELRESFRILLLDRGNRALGTFTVGVGGVHGVVADPKVIFCVALKVLCSSIVLSHNHPSGQLRPSEEDLAITRKLSEASRLLDIDLMDHVILTREGHFSFRDNGLL